MNTFPASWICTFHRVPIYFCYFFITSFCLCAEFNCLHTSVAALSLYLIMGHVRFYINGLSEILNWFGDNCTEQISLCQLLPVIGKYWLKNWINASILYWLTLWSEAMWSFRPHMFFTLFAIWWGPHSPRVHFYKFLCVCGFKNWRSDGTTPCFFAVRLWHFPFSSWALR